MCPQYVNIYLKGIILYACKFNKSVDFVFRKIKVSIISQTQLLLGSFCQR